MGIDGTAFGLQHHGCDGGIALEPAGARETPGVYIIARDSGNVMAAVAKNALPLQTQALTDRFGERYGPW